MIIVGELINASRKSVKAAIEAQDSLMIQNIADSQAASGASYIDVNAGVFVEKEKKYLNWCIDNIIEVTDLPVCIDSSNGAAIESALAYFQKKSNAVPMINSISLEKKKMDQLLPLISGTDLKIVAMCMNDEGMPKTVEERLSIAEQLVNVLVQNNVKIENIYIDPLVQALSTDSSLGKTFLVTIEEIIRRYEGIHTMCGLSNISYGLPNRKDLNRVFMSMAIAKGLDGAIINPLDKQMMATITTADALVGRDEFCKNYLKAYRAGKLDR